MFWNCKVCLEKDKRIVDLKSQIAHLQELVKQYTNTAYPKAVEIEANQILSGANTFVESLGHEEQKQLSAVERQAIELLTGNY